MIRRKVDPETGGVVDLTVPQKFERGQRQRAKRIAGSKEASVIYDRDRMLMHPARTTSGKEDARLSNDTVIAQDQPMPRRRAVWSIAEVVLAGVGANVIGRTRRVRRFVDEIQVVVPGFEEH
jgi:hypothetical protein